MKRRVNRHSSRMRIRQRKWISKMAKQQRSDKEFLARYYWAFESNERERYYHYVNLILICTSIHLKDLLLIKWIDLDTESFCKQYPDLDPLVVNWLKRRSISRHCEYLLYKRSPNSYSYHNHKLRSKGCRKNERRSVIPMLKRVIKQLHDRHKSVKED